MPTAAEWNALCDMAERAFNLTSDPSTGVEVVRSGGPLSLRLSPKPVEVVECDTGSPDPTTPGYYDGSVLIYDTTSGLQTERQKCWIFPVESIPPGPPGPAGPSLSIVRVLGPYTTLTEALPNASGTGTMLVQSNQGFPGSNFYVLIGSEMILVTTTGGGNSVTWSVTRAQLGTSAAAHNAGTVLQQATFLSSGITAGATSLTVNSGSVLPTAVAAQPFYIIIGTEVLGVTAGAGTTTLTVTRGAFGTTAASHLANAAVTLWLNAALSTSLNIRQAVLTTFAPGTNTWTETSTIMLAPAENLNPLDPFFTPLQSNNRYFCQQNGTVSQGGNSVPFYQTFTPHVAAASTNPDTGDTAFFTTACSVINFDMLSGLTVAGAGGPNFARGVLVGCQPASATHNGVVNQLDAQQFSGYKEIVPASAGGGGNPTVAFLNTATSPTLVAEIGLGTNVTGASSPADVFFSMNKSSTVCAFGLAVNFNSTNSACIFTPATGVWGQMHLQNNSITTDSFYSVVDKTGTTRNGISTTITPGSLFSGGIIYSSPTAPTITGSRGGNAALASLLTALNTAGFIVNSSTP